jgi:hypothetical protein
MKKLLLLLCLSFSISSAFAQTSITSPGDDQKSITIKGELLGEMKRSSSGVHQFTDTYYYSLSGESLTIWKHIYTHMENKVESMYVTTMQLADIDWAYFESSFPDGAKMKKVGGEEYHTLSINAQRGKRFKQENYYLKSTASDVTIGNVDIKITDAEAMKAFYDKLIAAKK